MQLSFVRPAAQWYDARSRESRHALRRCGLTNPRWIYATVRMDDAQTLAFVDALGFVRVPALDFEDPQRPLAAITRDHGVGGVIAGTRDLVYRDLGLEPPAAFDRRDAVRRALRDFHDSVALSANPLAQGTGTTQRAEHVRARVIAALDIAFGSRPDDRLTRAVIERGYFDADGGHDRAQRELFMSRTTYFRRASTGLDRITVAIDSLTDSIST
jgi:hypothetical protein